VSAAAATDAHALIWYAMGPGRRLGRTARNHFARAERGQGIVYVPVVVLVEIAEAMRRGAIRHNGSFSRWARALLASGRFVAAGLTAEIVLEAEALYGIAERGDRLIAATAVAVQCPLITTHPAFARIPPLTTVW
jgi:PIN domain nuclease of toxin-antitoxin system